MPGSGNPAGQPPQPAEQLPLAVFAERAYLDYSMRVVLDRALPTLGDGLKPVQRRIIYAMSELGLNAGAKPKKSARTIGDVIGKYHPHGDAACYEAMVLMAQPFSYRYPLIVGQGNWGSIDNPKSFAAMRYTEASLSAYAKTLIQELSQGTVDWRPNFDGTLEEPMQFPAQLPNLLLNGTSGIAVGMSTDVPPHNLNEVVAACIQLLDAPKTPLADLLALIKGPDFPGGGEIISSEEEIFEAYRSGTGVLRVRASYVIEQNEIVVTALPYQVSVIRVLEQVAAQVKSKRLPMVEDLRDESDQESPVRLVIVPTNRRVDKERLMSHLFATTDLECSHRINLNAIGNDGKPRVKSLDAMLREWIAFRKETLRRRLVWRRERIDHRLEVLEGLMVVYLNLEKIIEIIRNAKEPQAELMRSFGLSAMQARAILEIRLRSLSKLEEARIVEERVSLSDERKQIQRYLDSAARLKTLVKRELKAVAATCGDERRTRIVSVSPARAFQKEQLTSVEARSIVLSKMGWVRTVAGHEVDTAKLAYRTKDACLDVARGDNRRDVVFLDSRGRCYTLAAARLPEPRSRGEPLSSYFTLREAADFIAVITADKEALYLFVSDRGDALLTRFGNLVAQRRGGKQVLDVSHGTRAIAACIAPARETGFAAAVTSEGYMLLVALSEIPLLSKGKGNRLIGIPPKMRDSAGEKLVAVACVQAGQTLMVHAGSRSKRFRFEDLLQYQGKRGLRGRRLPRGYRNVSRLEPRDAPC